MEVGHYRVSEQDTRSMFGGRMNIDITNILQKLNIVSMSISLNECPSQAIRMNGNHDVDSLFKNKDVIRHKTEKGYELIKMMSSYTRELLNTNKNFKFYNFYTKTDCVNHNILNENIEKYPSQVFAK